MNEIPAHPERIIRRKLSDQVFERLLALIKQGEFAPDQHLPSERDLMLRFGGGRPAVREALQSLATMGLISISHGERARVTQPNAFGVIAQLDHAARHLLATSPQSLEHLKEAREFFEVGMAREAAAKANRADVTRLTEAIAVQAAQLGKDPAAFVAADMNFHTNIAAVTRNPIFEASSRAMLQWLSLFHVGVLAWRGRERRTLADHREILAAIAANDAELAASAMRSHLRRSRSTYERAGEAHFVVES